MRAIAGMARSYGFVPRFRAIPVPTSSIDSCA